MPQVSSTPVTSPTTPEILGETTTTTGDIMSIQVTPTGCEIVFAEQYQPLPLKGFQLLLSHGNYNALYSLMLACWLNKLKIDVVHRSGVTDAQAIPMGGGPKLPFIAAVAGRSFQE
jgi:hypothetical protein